MVASLIYIPPRRAERLFKATLILSHYRFALRLSRRSFSFENTYDDTIEHFCHPSNSLHFLSRALRRRASPLGHHCDPVSAFVVC